MSLTARQVLLELVSAQANTEAEIPVRALIRAAEVFSIGASSTRVALLRLANEGNLTSTRRGWYRLGDAAAPIHERVSTWRALDELLTPWDGGWLAVYTAHFARSDRKAGRRRARALRLWGFEALDDGFYVRPSNLRFAREGVRQRLLSLGLEHDAHVMRVAELGEQEDTARALWPTAALDASYRRMTDQLDESEARLTELPLDEAAREAFVLGREALRLLILDPLLPSPLVDAVERRRLGETMTRYDLQGQALWRSFLFEH